MDLIKSVTDLTKSVTDLIMSVTIGIKSVIHLMNGLTIGIKSVPDLIKSVFDGVKSVMDLIKPVVFGVKSMTDLIKRTTDLTQSRTDLIPKTRFLTPRLPAKNRFNPPPPAYLPAVRRVASKTVISEQLPFTFLAGGCQPAIGQWCSGRNTHAVWRPAIARVSLRHRPGFDEKIETGARRVSRRYFALRPNRVQRPRNAREAVAVMGREVTRFRRN